ncbi:polysaccharide biosynthesis tyrosine autokinase [Georgenia sp. H159]|uniref:polysaccharide biosynthesis tyrosine autokinase n=1 Tax=Georgenia sp. H159 TaxID=3076115 RepID=UPI002D7679ED|nr:polysaccharide biosynthesis tyrosine autokinase [Georgenia sp. H159]
MLLADYFNALRRRWLTVVVIALTTIAAGATITLLATPQYTATTQTFFAVQGGESVSDLAQGSTFTEKQMASYARIAESPLVLDPIAETLGEGTDARDLAESITVTVAEDTTILVISATDPAPERARDIANAVADGLAASVGGLSPERPDGTESVRATTFDAAEVPESPSSPNLLLNLALGLVLGAVLGVGIALLREVLETKIRTEADITAVTTATRLATVPMDESASDHPVFMHDDSMSHRAEAIRRLRTNLQFVNLGDRSRSIVVTSSVAGEGKTTTAINLAVSLADAGSRVVLVDADLRLPSVADYLGFEGGVGLTTVLIGRVEVADAVQPWRDTRLDILASGSIPPNPSELLGSDAMSRLLAELAAAYDVIILDSPPLLPVTDAAILSRMADGTLVVAGADRLHKQQLRASLDALETVDAHVLGVVLNKAQRKERDRYSYEYRSSDTSGRSPAPSLGRHSVGRSTPTPPAGRSDRRLPASRL